MQVVLKHDAGTLKAGTPLTLRRPTARDMIAIGDHLPVLSTLDENNAAAMNSSVFEAMVAVAGTLSGIGQEQALDLDYEDLVAMTTVAFSFLEKADGQGGSGEPQ